MTKQLSIGCRFILALWSIHAVANNAVLPGADESSYKITEPADIILTTRPELPDLSSYTVDAVREQLPNEVSGSTARLVPISQLYFIPTSNIWGMRPVWENAGLNDPACIVLSRGHYTLTSIYEQINDAAVLNKQGEREYLLSRPLYIAPGASLILRDGDWLKLSLNDGTFIVYNGHLYSVDARISTWDKTTENFGERAPLSKKNVLMYGVQSPRSYLLGLEGSKTYAANSEFIGLGYKGASGSFGISLSSTVGDNGLGVYLSSLPRPTGWFIGNHIEDLYFGFYSAEADDVVLVGNEFVGNLIYGIDPHDYSERFIIARNVAHGSEFSHGIIVSREVNDSWIAQNLSLRNSGSGIMLDRMSSNNTISENIVFANQGDGIAVYESDDNSVHGNVIGRNQRNGVYVRNSLEVDVYNNIILNNGRNGAEVAGVNIDYLETRDFVLDPYHISTSALLLRNHFNNNFNSAVAAKSIQQLVLFDNQYLKSGPLYFSGDLQPFAAKLLRSELKRQQPIGLVNTEQTAQTSTVTVTESASLHSYDAIERIAQRGAPHAMVALARLTASDQLEKSIYWYARAIMSSRPSAMRDLGLLLLSNPQFSQEQRAEGLVLYSMTAFMGDARVKLDLQLLPDIMGITPQQLAQAKKEALQRLRTGKFWNPKPFPQLKIRLQAEEARLARKRAQRIAAAFKKRNTALSSSSTQSSRQMKDAYEDTWREGSDKNTALRNLRIEAQQILNQHATGEQRAYLDRVAAKQSSAKSRLEQFTDAERQAWIKRIEQSLELINYHRSEEAAIKFDPQTLSILPTSTRAKSP